uniref:Inner capsid protein VP2 n=1 Tax=Rotavirus X (isolate RVX/Human/Bangladesh/NADRV-B219/2002/GXP[X]) TaxID=348136 RepID=VP2_ROTB2|nr:RecName: Full=Inner capsid protein VP2 [Human rotavirus B219]ABR32123.1 VP2 [Human rotavirus B219]
MEVIEKLETIRETLNDTKDKKDFQKIHDELVQYLDGVDSLTIDDDKWNEILKLFKTIIIKLKSSTIKTTPLENELLQHEKKRTVKEVEKVEEDIKTDVTNDTSKPTLMDKVLQVSNQPNNPYSADVLQIRTILSKTLFVDTDSEAYSLYVPESQKLDVSPITIELTTIEKYQPKVNILKQAVIVPSQNPLLADTYGAPEILFSTDFFDDITSNSSEGLQLYFFDKAYKLKKELPNLPFLSSLDKDVNPLNPLNSVCKSFGQEKYYDMVMDRTDRGLDARRAAMQFDNVIVDAQNRTVQFNVRMHPFDLQLLRISQQFAEPMQDLAPVVREYMMLGADGYVLTQKIRLDRDQQLIANRRSVVFDRMCELSGPLYRSRIIHSMRMMSKLWRTNVFRTSLEDEITKIYAAAEVSMISIDATTSALSTINIASAEQTLNALLNMSFFRCELDLIGSQSSFGAAMSAMIALMILPTDQENMDDEVFDVLCNLVYNELIAWAADRPVFVRRAGATNAFRQFVNAGLNRDITNYMRFVLLRRPWLPLYNSRDVRRNAHVLVPNVDLANINDQVYVAINSFLNGIIEASRRNPNPNKTISANSFRKLMKNMRDICVNRLMPVIRLIRYNVERIGMILHMLPYSADIFDINRNLRDERLRIKIPMSGFLSLVMGITKAPDAFDWSQILNFADDVRKMDYAEAISIEDSASVAIMRNDANRATSKKEIFISEVRPPTPTVASIQKIPSATLTAIFSDRQLINLIRDTHSFRVIREIAVALQAAFDNSPTSQHGVGKGAVLHPVPQNFGRSSQFVRRDNILLQRPAGIQQFTIEDLKQGRYFQGLMAQIRARQPIIVNGPIPLRISDAAEIEQVTLAFLTMNSPYDAYIDPRDLKQQKLLTDREVDLFIDQSPARPNDEFDNVMARTSVFIIDAPRAIVPINPQRLNFPYHDIMVTDSVTKFIEFTVALTPDLQLFNGLLVFEQ